MWNVWECMWDTVFVVNLIVNYLLVCLCICSFGLFVCLFVFVQGWGIVIASDCLRMCSIALASDDMCCCPCQCPSWCPFSPLMPLVMTFSFPLLPAPSSLPPSLPPFCGEDQPLVLLFPLIPFFQSDLEKCQLEPSHHIALFHSLRQLILISPNFWPCRSADLWIHVWSPVVLGHVASSRDVL